MPQSDESRELGGLARSIAALFARPAAAPAPQAAEAEQDTQVTPADAPEPPALHAVSWDAPEAAARSDVEAVPWEVPTPEEASAQNAASADTPAQDELPALEATPAHEVVEQAARPDDLARAVEAYLAGDPDAAGDVRTLAEGLRERLALDPLADAVEQLVLGAGDPPDEKVLDLASEVIDPAVASRIVQRIGHERDDERRAEYRRICRRLGRVMAVAFRGALTEATGDEARRAYYDILIGMGDISRPVIDGMVEDENLFLVRNGVSILGEIGGERAKELVTAALANTDPRVRRDALLALGKIGDEGTGALVLGYLEDTDGGVRLAAAVAAGELKVERALRGLLAMLGSETDPDALVPFLRALGKLKDPGAVQAIERHAVRSMFSKPPVEVRIAAYQALHSIGTPHARQLVQAAVSDKEPAVQAAARKLLRSGGELTSAS